MKVGGATVAELNLGQLTIVVRLTLARLLEQEHNDRVGAGLVVSDNLRLSLARDLRRGRKIPGWNFGIRDSICGICQDYKVQPYAVDFVLAEVLSEQEGRTS